jgi:hypothetical protein
MAPWDGYSVVLSVEGRSQARCGRCEEGQRQHPWPPARYDILSLVGGKTDSRLDAVTDLSVSRCTSSTGHPKAPIQEGTEQFIGTER